MCTWITACMRCDKKKAQLFSSTGARNEHTPGGQAEMRNDFVRHVLCRAHPQAAPVCVRALLSWKELAEGKIEDRDLMHSRQQKPVKLCTPRVSGTGYEKGAKRNESCIRCCPQVGAGDQLMRANCGRAKPAAAPPVFPSTLTEKLAPISSTL